MFWKEAWNIFRNKTIVKYHTLSWIQIEKNEEKNRIFKYPGPFVVHCASSSSSSFFLFFIPEFSTNYELDSDVL